MSNMQSSAAFDSEIEQLLKFNTKPIPQTSVPARWQQRPTAMHSKSQSLGNDQTQSTPSRKPKGSSKTPVNDRFIPTRSDIGSAQSYYQLRHEDLKATDAMSPSKQMFRKNMEENLVSAATLDTNSAAIGTRGATTGLDMGASPSSSACSVDDPTGSHKILTFRNKAPVANTGYRNNMRVLYSHNKRGTAATKPARVIPQHADRILDAPELVDDYYLNLLDWNSQNLLAVALGANVYLWNATSGDIHHLLECEGTSSYVTSVSWIEQGNYLAVGNSDADVQIWDVNKVSKVREMKGHSARVGALSWNQSMLSSGSRSGDIIHHDVRVQQHHVATLKGHTQEVCGLKWSPDGNRLASGGNDNVLNIWDNGQHTKARHTLTNHTAAVKALAWCPWQMDLLCSGGGTADRCLRFWNTNSGQCLNTIDTQSQVCSVLWNKEHREVVSSHGFAQNQLIVWKYPTMTKVAELTGHTSRVLHMAASPDGQTVVSAAGDETLRFWKVFAADSKKKAKKMTSSNASSISLRGMMR